MSTKNAKSTPHVLHHKDGSIWAKGEMTGAVMTGSWVWFRKDGSKMRSGSFDAKGQQTGEWTTFDAKGRVYEVTKIKPKAK